MRRAATALLVTALGAGAAHADPHRMVATGFAAFEQVCATAVTDPQGYVDSVPNPGPLGNRTVTVSPDGQVIYVTHAREGFGEYVHFIRLPEVLTVACVVHNEPDYTDALMSQLDSHASYERLGQHISEALLAYAAGRPDIDLVGGHVPVEYVAQTGGGIERFEMPFSYQYGFYLSAGALRLPSLIEVMDGAITFHVFRSIEVGQ